MEIRAARMTVIAVLAGSLVFGSNAVSAGERRGAQVKIELKTGGYVGGELIAFRGDSLLVLDSSGDDESVEIAEIRLVRVIRKSRLGTGALVGLLIGGVAGGVWGHNYAEEGDGEGENGLIIGGAIFGAAGAGIGMGLGAALGMDRNLEFEGQSEKVVLRNLKSLKRIARVRE